MCVGQVRRNARLTDSWNSTTCCSACSGVMLTVLYEDNHCLAVSKSAGVIVQGGNRPPTLLDEARAYLKQKYHKPAGVFLGVVHRLDTPVSGVVLLARTSKAAARLSEQFRRGTVEKLYWAFVEERASGKRQDVTAKPRRSRRVSATSSRRAAEAVSASCASHVTLPPDLQTWEDYLLKDRKQNVVRVVSTAAPGAKLAVLEVRRLAKFAAGVLVEVRPRTGRSHQIRVQLAARGWPILGDTRYGSCHAFWADEGRTAGPAGLHRRAIALHARWLCVEHPVRHEPLVLEAPLPRSWRRLVGSWSPS